MPPGISTSDFYYILPELVLTGGALLLLIVDVLLPKARGGAAPLAWVTILVLGATAIALAPFSNTHVEVAGGLLAVIISGAVTGNDANAVRPVSVDRLIPSSGAEILRQGQVGVDLAAGYDAYLIINGIEIRNQATGDDADGLTKVLTADGYTITYTPGPGRRIERLRTDENQVTAMVWAQPDGPSNATPVYWTFSAS